MTNFTNRLLNYSALSASIIAGADLNGQIVYTDLEPDEVLTPETTYDFRILNGLTQFTLNNNLGPKAFCYASSGGAFVGIMAYGYAYPAVMAEGDLVDNTSLTSDGNTGYLNWNSCSYSNSQWCGSVVDGYLGIKFKDLTTGLDHYGWVRMDLDYGPGNSHNITIKEYAFESNPDTPITVGDQGSLGFDQNYWNSFNYSFDQKILQLNFSSPIETVRLLDIQGKEMAKHALNSSTGSINLEYLTSGVYIVLVNSGNQIKTIKLIKS